MPNRSCRQISLSRTPVIRNLLVIEVPDASDKGMMTVLLRPIDCFFLSLESAEHVVSYRFRPHNHQCAFLQDDPWDELLRKR